MGRPQIVVLGMMTKIPVAGVVWQTLHYLVGFERLGYVRVNVAWLVGYFRPPGEYEVIR